MTCCNPYKTGPVYENRKSEEPPKEVLRGPCCPLFKVTSIICVGNEVLLTLDDCTYLKAPLTVVDESVIKGKSGTLTAKIEELTKALESYVRKNELVDVANWSGEVKFKAYPAE